jgi:hypothetical protein
MSRIDWLTCRGFMPNLDRRNAFVFGQNRLGDGHLQLACEDEIEHVPLVAFAIQMRRYDYVRIEHNPDSSHRS